MAPALLNGIHDGIIEIPLSLIALLLLILGQYRAIANLHRIKSPGDINHRRRLAIDGKMTGEFFRIDGGRGNDELEVLSFLHQLMQKAKQKINIQTPLVSLIDDNSIVFAQERITQGCSAQDIFDHQLADGRRPTTNQYSVSAREPHR